MRQHHCQEWYEFLIEVAGTLDANTLAQQSRSFALFRDALLQWQIT
jgi:hypothetical protein